MGGDGGVGRQAAPRPETDLFPMGTEPLTLQATACCGCEGDGRFNISWDLRVSGPKLFHIDSNTIWEIEVDSGSKLTKETLERIKEAISFLNRTSQGECKSWFEETKLYCEENVEPTGKRRETSL